MLAPQAQELLEFWFADLGLDGEISGAALKLWFGKDVNVDRKLARRFGRLVEAAADGELAEWEVTPHGRLALILLCDQLPRNIYRDTPGMFSLDPRGLALALEGLDRGDDQCLGIAERAFFYLPLEHAEDLALQERSVLLFAALQRDGGTLHSRVMASFLDYAERHRDIIARFGRFPHRNRVLGRVSTEEELEFLRQPGSSF